MPHLTRSCRLILLVGAFALIGASCSSDDSPSSSTTAPPGTIDASAIDESATLRFGATTIPASWDPHLEREVGERKTLWQVWDRLLMLSPTLTLEPGIATEWTFSDDGLELTLALRTDARFHDGSTVDAESVKASLDRALALEGSTAAAQLQSVDSVEVVDAATVGIKLKEPASYLPFMLATSAGSVINARSLAADVDIARNPNDAASGAYLVDSFVPAESAVLVRSEDPYWDPDAGKVARFEFTAYADNAAALAALKTGTLDIVNANAIEAQAVTESIAGTDLVHYQFPVKGPFALFLNAKVAPLDNPDVRKAVVMGVDRGAIATGLMGDESFIALQGVPEDDPAYIDGYEGYAHDPEGARALLAAAGYPNGFDLPMIFPSGNAVAELSALAMQEHLAEIGVRVQLNPVAPPDFVQRWRDGTVASMSIIHGGEADTYLFVNRTFFGTWDAADPATAADLAAAMDEAVGPGKSDSEREAAYEAMLEEALSGATWNPIGFSRGQFVAQPYVLGVDQQPFALLVDVAGDPRYLAISSDR